MLLVFAALGLRLGFLTVILAHAAFTVSYGYVVVRARIAGFDRSLEEAALDLGARPAPGLLEGHAAADPAGGDGGGAPGLRAVDRRLRRHLVRRGRRRHHAAAADLLDGEERALAGDQRRLDRAAAVDGAPGAGRVPDRAGPQRRGWPPLPAGLGLADPAAALRARRRAGRRPSARSTSTSGRTTSPPRRSQRFEARHGVRVNVDLYDSNEALLAKLQARQRRLRRGLPVRLLGAGAARARACCARSTTRRCRTSRTSTRAFLDRPYDPGNRHSVPYFWGTTRDRLRHAAREGARRLLGRPLGPALRRAHPDARRRARGVRRGAQAAGALAQQPGPGRARAGAAPTSRSRSRSCGPTARPTSTTCCSRATSGWRRAGAASSRRSMTENPTIAYVVPKEGATLFIDNLAIPRDAPQPGAGARLHRLHARGRDRRRDLPHHALLDSEPRGARAAAAGDPDEPGHLPAAGRGSAGSS